MKQPEPLDALIYKIEAEESAFISDAMYHSQKKIRDYKTMLSSAEERKAEAEK